MTVDRRLEQYFKSVKLYRQSGDTCWLYVLFVNVSGLPSKARQELMRIQQYEKHPISR